MTLFLHTLRQWFYHPSSVCVIEVWEHLRRHRDRHHRPKTKISILKTLLFKYRASRKQTSNQHRWRMEKTLNLRVHKRSFNENSNLSEILRWQWIYSIHFMLKMHCVCVWNTIYATIIVLPNVNTVFHIPLFQLMDY